MIVLAFSDIYFWNSKVQIFIQVPQLEVASLTEYLHTYWILIGSKIWRDRFTAVTTVSRHVVLMRNKQVISCITCMIILDENRLASWSIELVTFFADFGACFLFFTG